MRKCIPLVTQISEGNMEGCWVWCGPVECKQSQEITSEKKCKHAIESVACWMKRDEECFVGKVLVGPEGGMQLVEWTKCAECKKQARQAAGNLVMPAHTALRQTACPGWSSFACQCCKDMQHATCSVLFHLFVCFFVSCWLWSHSGQRIGGFWAVLLEDLWGEPFFAE